MGSEDRRGREETRQERRARRLRKKQERMPQHGRGLAQAYKDAILKRLRRLTGKEKK